MIIDNFSLRVRVVRLHILALMGDLLCIFCPDELTPERWLVRDRFDSAAKIPGIRAPLLIVHGERDRTVPIKFDRSLYAAAAEPKEMRVLPDADHTDLYDHGAGEIMHEFLARRIGWR